jgi:ComF family protein
MILGLKHADKIYAAKAFTPWLSTAGASMLSTADILIPVPLHRTRLLMRRYNQAAIIAQTLGQAHEIKTCVHTLKRSRPTKSQGHLAPLERHKNVKHAFAIDPKRKSQIKDKTIILVDDVYTTGATVKECTKILLKAGAANVHVLTLARVVKGEYYKSL